MDDQLLVRIYNVGLGDCIYIRVPDQAQEKHILIDCGNTDADEFLLGKAIDHLASVLPTDGTGEPTLDLLVVTHPHQDHIAGFGVHADKFLGFRIRNIWLSASMNPDHKQAEKSFQLQAFSDAVVQEFAKLNLGPAFNNLASELLGLSNDGALTALRTTLPQKNGLPGNKPTYVHDEADLETIFDDPGIQLQILGPRNDIDGEYLGKIDQVLNQFTTAPGDGGADDPANLAQRWGAESQRPKNIGSRDFNRLRSRLFLNALAFVLSNNVLVNNTSVVLLLEWHGRRLLFTGDAQFRETRKGKYEFGKRNGSWNVMWHYYHKNKLKDPIDFLKIGHHGSHNATPWVEPEDGEEHPINQILDALLRETDPKTEVVVSTERMKYPSIPDRSLLAELGKRVKTRRKYDEPLHLQGRMVGGKWAKYDPDEILVPKSVFQPLRTDLEYQHQNEDVSYIDIEFKL